MISVVQKQRLSIEWWILDSREWDGLRYNPLTLVSISTSSFGGKVYGVVRSGVIWVLEVVKVDLVG